MSDKVKDAPEYTPEQSAILASAGKVESELSGQILHDGQGNLIDAEEVEQENPAEENRQILSLLVGLATPALPFLEKCYTPDVIEAIATAYTAVEQKYGWNLRSHMGCEVSLALVAIPPTIAAVVLGREHFAEKRAQREAEGKATPAQIDHEASQGDRTNVLGAN